MTIRKQFAALPYIQLAKKIEVCLITSRETGRWIIPKGWPSKNLAPHELAELEAFEEAGLKGRADPRAFGKYHYRKRLNDGSDIDCDVAVYPMLVEYQAMSWPEQDQRQAVWAKRKKAARLVDDQELSILLRRFKPESCSLIKPA